MIQGEIAEQDTGTPALLGGTPLFPEGPPDWPGPQPDVLQSLLQAHADGTWGKYAGGHCDRLEALLRESLDVGHLHLVASGTYAVELGLRALKVGPGDEVILSAYDFPGNFLAVHALGAEPVLVDASPYDASLWVEQLSEAVSPRTRVVLASHLHGGQVPMPELMEFARDCGLLVLEDAAQAVGARVRGRAAGTWGDAGVLSFGGSKLVTAGRGGALLTNSVDVWQRARSLLLRGNLLAPLSELQAAVILPQWRRLADLTALRWQHVQLLGQALGEVPGLAAFADPHDFPPSSLPAFYKLGFRVSAEEFGLPRDALVKALRAEGLAFDAGFAAAHVGRSPRRYRRGNPLVNAERLHRECMILHHPILLEGPAMPRIAAAIRRIHRHRERLGGG